jgi:hypothetical protein
VGPVVVFSALFYVPLLALRIRKGKFDAIFLAGCVVGDVVRGHTAFTGAEFNPQLSSLQEKTFIPAKQEPRSVVKHCPDTCKKNA